MSVSQRLKTDASHLWDQLCEHPFITGLFQGTLPMEKFKFYVLQDSSYLISAIKNFNIIASRAPTVRILQELLTIIHLEGTGELEQYRKFLKRIGTNMEAALAREPMPANISYTSYLFSVSNTRPFQEALVSVLPCFWSYAVIADYHHEHYQSLHEIDTLYADWVSTYYDESYRTLVEKMNDLVDQSCENYSYEKLLDVFLTSSRYEYLYWDAAYRFESWPVDN
ncbi:MAG TPA: thiaminase II [bacterium]|nr:thiaminase II [bacterium]